MNDRLNRFRTIGLLAILALSATLFLAALGPGVAGQPGQSPLSPVMPVGQDFTTRLGSRLARVLDRSFWLSPLPWVTVGLVFFSALAWALVRTLHQAQRAEMESEERSLPPGFGRPRSGRPERAP
jgi:hypothetical protein